MGECSSATPAAAAAAAKTSVWWDLDKCAVPRGRCDPHRIAYNVIAALASAGYTGPVSIAAYGDAARVAPPVLQALSATGICLTHVPAGGKDTSDKRMLVDMLFWAFDNPPPGNFLVISGDQELSDLLHRLRMKRYDILLMRPSNASSQVLAGAAKKVWFWESLAAGELLLPEPPPASTVLGCKLNLNNSSSVPGFTMNVNNSDTLKCSQSKAGTEHGKGDGNLKAGNHSRVKPLQMYVKRTICASSPAGNQDQVESVVRVSESSNGSIPCELDHSSVSSSSSSCSDSLEKVNTSIPQETPVLCKSSAQTHVLSTQSHRLEVTGKSILGEKPSTSIECVIRSGSSDSGGDKRHLCNQTYQQTRYSEAQNGLHSEFKVGDNNGKAANQHRVKQLQKYVKKKNTTFGSASNEVDSVVIPKFPILNTTSGLDQSSVSSSSSSETLDLAKADDPGQPETSTLSHSSALKSVSSAPKSVAAAHLHQVRPPQEFILAKKPGISVDHASRNGTQHLGVSTVRYRPVYQQSQYSETQNKLNSSSSLSDNSEKFGNKHKGKQHQVYVKKIDISSASESNESVPINGILDNPKTSTLSHPSQSMSTLSNSNVSKSLHNAKVNQSSPLRNPPLSMSSGHKSVVTDQERAELIFGKKDSTSVQCTYQNGAFVFGVSSGHFHPAYQQSSSSLLLEQHNSDVPHTHTVHGNSHSIISQKGSFVPASTEHNGVPAAQIQAWHRGSTFQGLDDICHGIDRLNISEWPPGIGETGTSFIGAAANSPSKGMPDIFGYPSDLSRTGSSPHPDSNTSCYLNNCGNPQSGQLLSSSHTCGAAPPNLSIDMQNPGLYGEKPVYQPNTSEPEGTIGHILHALNILKTEQIFPTESNIADCIRYGEMNLGGFDVKKALELAIRHEAIVMKKLVKDMPLFVAKDESLWKCVNVTNSKAKNPKEELDAVYKYLSSTDGHSALKNSQSRYQAAMILKKSCLQLHALGDVLQVLHIAIVRKKWLLPHSSGWQPLFLNTTAVIASSDANSKA